MLEEEGAPGSGVGGWSGHFGEVMGDLGGPLGGLECAVHGGGWLLVGHWEGDSYEDGGGGGLVKAGRDEPLVMNHDGSVR